MRTRPAEQGRRMFAPGQQYPMPRAIQNPPHQRHSREGGRERSDRCSKSRQHNLQDLLSSEPRENPPSKGDSLANASSGARQGDVYNGQDYRYAPNTPRVSPAPQEIPDKNEVTDRSKSRQHNLKDYLPAGVSSPVKSEIRSNQNPPTNVIPAPRQRNPKKPSQRHRPAHARPLPRGSGRLRD